MDQAIKKSTFLLLSLMAIASLLTAQEAEKVKTGKMVVPLPAFQYNTDKGLIFGAAIMLYDFGDGEYYPNTKKNTTINAMYSTKGSSDLSVSYDNKHFLRNLRLISTGGYRRDKCYQFYGLNGYGSPFNPVISPVFNYYDKANLWAGFDVLKKIGKDLQMKAGYSFQYVNDQPADLNSINKGKKAEDVFQGETLYEKYIRWGILSGDDIAPAVISSLKAGLRYDTRDQEAAPQSGIFAEADLELAPRLLGTTGPFYRYELTWRHYVPLVKERLVFAYRLNYNGLLGNDIPFRSIPVNNSLRGVLMNRIQAPEIGMINSELRWLSKGKTILKQNIALGINGFYDCARGMRLYNTTFSGLEEFRNEFEEYTASGSKESWHKAAGVGVQVLVNRNFICRIEYGHPFSQQDNQGNSLYFTFGYHF